MRNDPSYSDRRGDVNVEQQREDISYLLDAVNEFNDRLDGFTHGGELALPSSFDDDFCELEVLLTRVSYRCRDELQKFNEESS